MQKKTKDKLQIIKQNSSFTAIFALMNYTDNKYIKFATNHMIMDCKEEKLNQYLGHGYFEKPKVKEIIFKVLSKIL